MEIPEIRIHKNICDQLHDTYVRKNHDYGNSFSKIYDKFGLLSSFIRLNDKLNRIESLMTKQQQVHDESIEDTLLDMANYCILTIVEMKKQKINVVHNDVLDYKAVDLGLPSGLLWADRNVGSLKPEDYGLYFAWGDVMGYGRDINHIFDRDNYPLKNDIQSMSELDCVHDAATINMGGEWHMPNINEFNELLQNCTNEWISKNGVDGILFTSKINCNTLFFPAAGFRRGFSIDNVGYSGCCWSRLFEENVSAYGLYFSNEDCRICSDGYYFGRSVRGVKYKD